MPKDWRAILEDSPKDNASVTMILSMFLPYLLVPFSERPRWTKLQALASIVQSGGVFLSDTVSDSDRSLAVSALPENTDPSTNSRITLLKCTDLAIEVIVEVDSSCDIRCKFVFKVSDGGYKLLSIEFLSQAMPKAFDDCVKSGGRVRTVKPTKGTYAPVCFPKGGGPSVFGGVKKVKK